MKGDGSAASAVIDESVDGFLEHALFITDDDVRSFENEKAIEAIIAVDDAAIEVVKVGSSESAAVELNHRAKFRRDNGNDVKNHPFGLIAGFSEGFDDFEATNSADALLTIGGRKFLAELRG